MTRPARIARPLSPRALAPALLLGLCACGSEDARPPSLLLISVDSLRADHLSYMGYPRPTSPNIDRMLAEEGVVFERCVSTTSWTLPAHMALLTGLPNTLHGVLDAPDVLHEDHVLLAQVLQQHGWRTAGFWSGPNVHPFWGFDRGFEEYVDCSAHVLEDPNVFGQAASEGFDEIREVHDLSHEGITGPRVVSELSSWLDGVGEDEPFFAFAHMWDVHYDYTPPPEHDLWDRRYTGDVEQYHMRELLLGNISNRDLTRLKALYDGEIHFTDHNISQMLVDLELRGRLDDTLVVFVSDHGEEFYEHELIGHKTSLYDEVVHVPLIFRWPDRLPTNERLTDLVCLTDVTPTILDLFDLPTTPRMWGRSLRPAWEGSLESRPVPLELTSRPHARSLRGLLTTDFKVVHSVNGNKKMMGVFDLTRDENELDFIKAADVEGLDPRMRQARVYWQRLDDIAAGYEREEGVLPGQLGADLEHAGYAGDGDEEEEYEEEDDEESAESEG